MLHHGGRLLQAAQQFHIPVIDWLDLSTGINPIGWPVPLIDQTDWQRLPDPDDGLLQTAADYYQCQMLLPVAGSQAAIQMLPYLRSQSRVGVPIEAYDEHRYHWQQAGHQVIVVATDQINQHIDRLDVLILLNPNNPTGECFSAAQLLDWQQRLHRRGGWLIVDEAFIDTTPEKSLLPHCPRPGLIVLRSIGKFFGLAGIRSGFVAAEANLLDKLAQRLGPWTLSGPTRTVSQLALADRSWQVQTQNRLQTDARRLQRLMQRIPQLLLQRQLQALQPEDAITGTALFQSFNSHAAEKLFDHFAQQGILTRLFDPLPQTSENPNAEQQPRRLRIGLPGSELQWQRLTAAIDALIKPITEHAIESATTALVASPLALSD
ncbi:MAG: threonine-phosphate decarboxylase CobD [Motiliproteus sp.]